MTAGSLFCFGLGYSAGFLARDLAGQGWMTAGTGREGASAPIALHRFARAHPLAAARDLRQDAALLLGVLDFVLKLYVPTGGTMFIYVLTILILLWRPQGLFGRKET